MTGAAILVCLGRRGGPGSLALFVRRRNEAMKGVINFYRTDDEYGCFSNFAPYPVELKGMVWPTSEHYFQAQKFAGTEHEAEAPNSVSAQLGACDGGPGR